MAAMSLAVCGAATALPAAAISFDFEDGTLQGWQPTTTGGSGSTGVELHNGNKAAFVRHTGAGTHYLSYDFSYVATDRLSFDMHAVAIPSGRGDNAYSGITVSFLNAFNVNQGSMSLLNATFALSGRDFPVDNFPHHYDATLASFAAQAGVNTAALVAKVTLSFVSSANTNFFGDVSTGTVWADNIAVGVPEPSQTALLLAGLAGLSFLAKRRRRIEAS